MEFFSNSFCFLTRKIASKLIKKRSNIVYCINTVIFSCKFYSYITLKNQSINQSNFYTFIFWHIYGDYVFLSVHLLCL